MGFVFLACARVGLCSLSARVRVVPGVFGGCERGRGQALGGCAIACAGVAWFRARERGLVCAGRVGK